MKRGDRVKSIVAGALMYGASAANTIATFELSNVAFFDGVNTPTSTA
jgi:hypothetical protein